MYCTKCDKKAIWKLELIYGRTIFYFCGIEHLKNFIDEDLDIEKASMS